MSPRRMFQSCGSSSIAVARMSRPMRVTRGSFSTRLHGADAGLGVRAHRAELQRVERAAAEADALLRVEHRPAVLQLDRRRRTDHSGAETSKPGAGERDVECALQRSVGVRVRASSSAHSDESLAHRAHRELALARARLAGARAAPRAPDRRRAARSRGGAPPRRPAARPGRFSLTHGTPVGTRC